MYELASIALDMLFDQAGDWGRSLGSHSGGSSAPNKVPKLTIRNRTNRTASIAVCVGFPKRTGTYGVTCHAAGWYNLPSGQSYTQSVALALDGMHVVIYAEVPGANLEWSGNTSMYITRPDAFYITNALTRDARLTEGSGQLEVVNGNSFIMKKDQTCDLH